MKIPEDKTPNNPRLEHNPKISDLDYIRDILTKILTHAALDQPSKKKMRQAVSLILQDEYYHDVQLKHFSK